MEPAVATATGTTSKGGVTFFRQGKLDFSLTSGGLALTGNTNSRPELLKFIERLNALAAVLPDARQEGSDAEDE